MKNPKGFVIFKYYPRGLSLTVVEPNILLHKNLKENALKNKINLEIIKSKNRCTIGARFLNAQRAPQSKECGYRSTLTSSAEHLPFTENRFNFVVSTLVLCSVHDLKSVLVEIKRVLKKGGEYLCIEHVIDDKNYFRRIIQNIAAHSPWTFFGDYCHPNRDILGEIRNTGFSKINVKKYLQKDMGFMGWVISPHVVVCAEK